MGIFIVFFYGVLVVAAAILYIVLGFSAVLHFTVLIGGKFGFIGVLLAFCLCVGIWITGGAFLGAIVKTLSEEFIEK